MGKRPLPVSDHTQLEGGRGFGCLVLHFCHMHGKGFSFLNEGLRLLQGKGVYSVDPFSIKTAPFPSVGGAAPRLVWPPPLLLRRGGGGGFLIPLGRRPTRRKQGNQTVEFLKWRLFCRDEWGMGVAAGLIGRLGQTGPPGCFPSFVPLRS